ncbi:HD-GYP domain-containing protein [Roseateles sp.]|uniref:HD-GYP domain-containing protein n=1 Tax=Roseateles sp. TaxID=1971397 RepID=UPI003BA4D724
MFSDTLPAASGSKVFDEAATAQMECIIADLGRLYQERNQALREVARAHHDALLRLSMAAEFRDDDTGVHIMRIGFMAEAVALLAGQSRSYAQMLRRAAPMHDIGKIGVPDAVLKKPGAYTPQERQVMNQHPLIGAQILGRSRVPLFKMAAEVAMTHHERWDGSGYPVGLAGEAIPLCGRIVGVVDYFDALTMDRCYRPALADDVALQMLKDQRGLAFDPMLVDLMVEHVDALIDLRERINREPPSFESLVDATD